MTFFPWFFLQDPRSILWEKGFKGPRIQVFIATVENLFRFKKAVAGLKNFKSPPSDSNDDNRYSCASLPPEKLCKISAIPDNSLINGRNLKLETRSPPPIVPSGGHPL